MCLVCSKEQSHRDGCFEYTQHMIWLRNKKTISYAFLSGGLLVLKEVFLEIKHIFIRVLLYLWGNQMIFKPLPANVFDSFFEGSQFVCIFPFVLFPYFNFFTVK